MSFSIEAETIQDYIDHPPKGWNNLFTTGKEDLLHISKFIEKDESEFGSCLPEKSKIFKAYEMIKPSNIRVVIIGQDPYPTIRPDGSKVAQGLSFSVAKGIPIPPSLTTVFKELKRTITDFEYPSHGDLSKWIKQGVFLLNMSLTVRINEPGSHGRRWMGFIIRTLREISEQSPQAIYLLWGAKAQTLIPYISDKSTVLTAGHPSSMNRTNPFIGCNHFVEVNKLLDPPINWNV